MTISVTQLNNYIHGLLDIDGVLNEVSVAGEVTNVKQSRDGWYFSLKDNTAAIDCFCYGASCQPVVGMLAVAEGRINFWVKSGRISFFVRRLTVSQNTGAAYLKFLELKEKLQKEGLFEEARKKPVPKCCKKVGVVTSATGAVIHDIENVVRRRQPFSDVVLCSVKVQGAGAELEIAQGIVMLSQTDVDVIIVGRGGGSNEDLSAFNAEIVVRAVAVCEKPVVSAVGHGVDFTLCDFAADRRAVTPTEAAEFVTIDCQSVKRVLFSKLSQTAALLAKRLEDGKIKTLYSAKRISSDVERKVDSAKSSVSNLLSASGAELESKIVELRSRVQNATVRLSAANPANLLGRGYSVLSVNGTKISSVRQVKAGDKITARLSDGALKAKVEVIE